MAEIVVGYEEGDSAWIYEITPSDNFYDINGSLLALALGNYAYGIRQQALGLYREYGWQEEFAALLRIEGNQVRSARSITRNALGLLDVTDYVIFNAQYDDRRVPTTNPSRIRQVGHLSSNTFYLGDFETRRVSPAFGIYECRAPIRLKSGVKEEKSAKDCFSIETSKLLEEKRKTISKFIKSFSFSYF
ncbi:hypothetical protein [Serratia sp. P2ACOL2]|uniref:hypothetical protein n=1 Tax=Serratia sp. P2ACOL2 TaxID=2482769 RepID=UPI00138FFDA7|nr:hypothetical protein [Serratia sp. P2ACOL2]